MTIITDLESALRKLSLVTSNFGNADTFADVIGDWLEFLGGRPAEIVVVDGGSDDRTRQAYWDLFNRGVIDKLQVIRPDHFENSKDTCFYQEHTAGMIATRPYVLFFKSDTLPYRQGHDDWLPQAMEYLEREDTFAVGGSFNCDSRHYDACDGWYFSHKCSLNFSLMKRTSFIAAMGEFAGQYIASGFSGTSPAEATGQSRFLVEVAFEHYIARHQRYTLVKIEDPTWTVFHTNVNGMPLIDVRRDYLARRRVQQYMNAGLGLVSIDPLVRGAYYGQKRRRFKELRVKLGASPIGPWWRAVKALLHLGPAN